jgi:DUF4097 and DUF4098 domain-containing protein YvlB
MDSKTLTMKKSPLRAWLIVSAVSLAALAPRSLPAQSERFSRTVKVGKGASLEVSNLSGDIEVRAGTEDEIRIEAVEHAHNGRSDAELRRQLQAIEIEVNEMGSLVRVQATHRARRSHHVSVDFTIAVPADCAVGAKSVSGNVRTTALKGELRAESVSGDVTVAEAARLRLAKSVSGNVMVTGVSAADFLEFSSVSGEVDARRVTAREIEASSVSGGLRVEDVFSQRASLESVSGDIRYSGPIQPGGRYQFKTHSGDVFLLVASATGFEIEARTWSGEIQSQLPITVSEVRRGRMLRGIHGDGSAFIMASSFSGDVSIQKK